MSAQQLELVDPAPAAPSGLELSTDFCTMTELRGLMREVPVELKAMRAENSALRVHAAAAKPFEGAENSAPLLAAFLAECCRSIFLLAAVRGNDRFPRARQSARDPKPTCNPLGSGHCIEWRLSGTATSGVPQKPVVRALPSAWAVATALATALLDHPRLAM